MGFSFIFHFGIKIRVSNQEKLRPCTNCKNISPTIKLDPVETRRESEKARLEEPTSPKVSCKGHINHKKKKQPCKSLAIGKMFRLMVRLSWEPKIEIEIVNLPVTIDDWEFCVNETRDDEDKTMVPHSAPTLLGGGAAMEPKEISLWKRRNMDPPRSLQLT